MSVVLRVYLIYIVIAVELSELRSLYFVGIIDRRHVLA